MAVYLSAELVQMLEHSVKELLENIVSGDCMQLSPHSLVLWLHTFM